MNILIHLEVFVLVRECGRVPDCEGAEERQETHGSLYREFSVSLFIAL